MPKIISPDSKVALMLLEGKIWNNKQKVFFLSCPDNQIQKSSSKLTASKLITCVYRYLSPEETTKAAENG